jgi:hypothetical protein
VCEAGDGGGGGDGGKRCRRVVAREERLGRRGERRADGK